MKRGDVILVRFPQASGNRGKKRPAVVVQADAYATTVRSVVVAGITSNLALANDPACLLIDLATLEGVASGLQANSVVSGLALATVPRAEVDTILGSLSERLMRKFDDCLRAGLGIV